MWLDVCVLCFEKFAESVDGKLFDLVHYLTTSVISCSRISFRILVCADCAEGFEYLLAYIVFRRDQLDS